MRGETLSEAVQYERIEMLKLDFFDYIQKNHHKIDEKLPVFYGYVISALNSSFPLLDSKDHDLFLDAISFKILETSPRAADADFVETVIENAARFKKGKKPKAGLEIAAGFRMVKAGAFPHAIPYLRKYRSHDIMAHATLAYCYYALSLQEIARHRDTKVPSEMELNAREQMLELARVHRSIKTALPYGTDPALLRIFWMMITCAIEWFPSNPAFVRLGLAKAKADHNHEMRNEMLKIARARFYDDMGLLREAFHFAIEEGNGSRAADVVKQMRQQAPESSEPLYYGMLLALRTTKRSGYQTFRKQAEEKRMPPDVLGLLDLSFSLFSGLEKDVYTRIRIMRDTYPSLDHYLILINYLAHDIFSEEETRVKKAKKAYLDAVEAYCWRRLVPR
ncbi:hypothetical protein E2N92_12765 [Methanofollis formosanus]|uniref:Uncharacterized protein n=1 Tax=Methanofollis formosanus TaxID=299308 RepID=A0A8G1A2M3_9EURY|nr:hypothetical protein [Methanofollis formosanus]QYZ80239.1 hypothetical protein E2N92_12765 [Methanofollis formosanus]